MKKKTDICTEEKQEEAVEEGQRYIMGIMN
jgi:hypothetical protein